jgi:hypothetical protein
MAVSSIDRKLCKQFTSHVNQTAKEKSVDKKETEVSKTEEKKTKVPTGAIFATIFGITTLVLLFMPFNAISITVTATAPYNTTNTQIYNLSGFDLITGSTTYLGMSASLGESFPIILLILIGAILAVISGFILALGVVGTGNFILSDSGAKKASLLVVLAGTLIIAGSIVALVQISNSSGGLFAQAVEIVKSMFPTWDVSMDISVGWAIITEVIVGFLVCLMAAFQYTRRR